MDIAKISRRVFAELGKEKRLLEYNEIMHKLLGVVVDFINAEGETLKLSKMRRFTPFCAAMRATRSGAAACGECDQKSARSALLKHKALVYKCHAGLTDIAVPLYDRDDNYVGCMTSGQFHVEGERPDDKLAAEVAAMHGADPELLTRLFRETKVLSKTQVEGIIQYLEAAGRYIVETHNKLLFLESVDAPDKITLIKRHVEENHMRRLTVADTAKKFFLSPGRFCHFFKKEVGVGFICFVNMRRVARAEEMLRQTRRSVSEIAFLTGFGSVSQFNRMFRSVTGVSPREWRKSGRGAE